MLFYSCQSTKAEEEEREKRRAEKGLKTHAERIAEMEAEIEEQLKQNERPDGLVVKLRDLDDSIDIETSWPEAKLLDYVHTGWIIWTLQQIAIRRRSGRIAE